MTSSGKEGLFTLSPKEAAQIVEQLEGTDNPTLRRIREMLIPVVNGEVFSVRLTGSQFDALSEELILEQEPLGSKKKEQGTKRARTIEYHNIHPMGAFTNPDANSKDDMGKTDEYKIVMDDGNPTFAVKFDTDKLRFHKN